MYKTEWKKNIFFPSSREWNENPTKKNYPKNDSNSAGDMALFVNSVLAMLARCWHPSGVCFPCASHSHFNIWGAKRKYPIMTKQTKDVWWVRWAMCDWIKRKIEWIVKKNRPTGFGWDEARCEWREERNLSDMWCYDMNWNEKYHSSYLIQINKCCVAENDEQNKCRHPHRSCNISLVMVYMYIDV